MYLDKVTILKTRLNCSIQPVEPRIKPKINLIKTKKGKKSVKPKIKIKKKKSIKSRVKPKNRPFFGSLTGLIYKTIDKAHGYSAKQWENTKKKKKKSKQKTKETHNMKEACGGTSVAWGKSYPKTQETSFSKKNKKKKQGTYVICYTSIYCLMSLTTRERMIREGSRRNSILACRTNTTWHHTVGWTVQQFLSLINNPTYKTTPHPVPNPSQYSQKFSQIYAA